MKAPADRKQLDNAERLARQRGESAPGAGVSLTLAFLIAGALIVGAVAFLPAT